MGIRMSYLSDMVQKAQDEAFNSLFNKDMTTEQRHFLMDKAFRISSEYGIYIGVNKQRLGYNVEEELNICKDNIQKYLICGSRGDLNKVK